MYTVTATDANNCQFVSTVNIEFSLELTSQNTVVEPVSYTHLRAHETVLDLVCRLLLEKKTKPTQKLGFLGISTGLNQKQ